MTSSPPREGSLAAPTRYPIDWQNPAFLDEQELNKELERVFDICHGCRRCFNLCDSFPRLFDLIDDSSSGELDTVPSSDFKSVVDACTFCDMCFMTKCPYVPPHPFSLDFPHLMLRYRTLQDKQKKLPQVPKELAKIDRNANLAKISTRLANWSSNKKNKLTRGPLEFFTGVDKNVELPKFEKNSYHQLSNSIKTKVNANAPAFGRKAVIYSTCFVNYKEESKK